MDKHAVTLSFIVVATVCSVSLANEPGREKCPDVINADESTFIVNGTCYHLIENEMTEVTYEYARADCSSRSGHLLTIRDEVSQTALASELNRVGDSHTILIGARKVSGEWQWVTGEKMEYTNFQSTAGSGDCVRMLLAQRGLWERQQCQDKDWFTAYVCEHTTARASGASSIVNQSVISNLLLGAVSVFLVKLL